MKAEPKLDAVDWSGIDVVALSVPVSQNALVMKRLLPYASRLALVIDTPVASTLAELADCERLLPNFAKVLVTEDYMNFPLFRLLREAAADDLLGKPIAATLFNIGYLFHGLALARSFAGFAPVWRSHAERAGRFSTHVTYRLRGGFKAYIVGPYRPENNGGILLEGTKGVISEVAGDARWGNLDHRPHYLARRTLEAGQLVGYNIADEAGRPLYTVDLPAIREMRTLPFDDKSELNLCRGRGLMDVFLALLEPENINNAYGFESALYDSFVSRLAHQGRLQYDGLSLMGSNVMTLLRWMAKIQRAQKYTAS
ncbi:MAG: hypothetical protein FJ184_15630 [Gammaproteobacteria bacterium]|nr:hypothetical protein [Gammaproteobacteria bacterium]